MIARARLVAALLAMALALSACVNIEIGDDGDSVQPSGDVVSRTFQVEGFDAVSISHAFDATITRADDFSAEVSIDDNLLDYLVVEVRGDTLFVDLNGVRLLRGNATLEAEITLPTITRLDASGASRAELNGFDDLSDLEIDVSGASRVTGELHAADVHFDISGASSIELVGSAASAELDGSGASNLRLADFPIDTADVDLSGASRADVHVTEEIERVSVSGASHLTYSGDPVLGAVDSSGASTIDAR